MTHTHTAPGRSRRESGDAREIRVNADPAQAEGLKEEFGRDMDGRFRTLRGGVRDYIEHDDVLGVGAQSSSPFGDRSDAAKQSTFDSWIDDSTTAVLYDGGTWPNRHLEAGYSRGTERAFEEAEEFAGDVDIPAYLYNFESFNLRPEDVPDSLPTALTNPEGLRRFGPENAPLRIRLKAERELEGLSQRTAQELSREFADGLREGVTNSQEMADRLNERLRTIQNVNGEAYTEFLLMQAVNDGAVDTYERLGVDEVGVLPEGAPVSGDGFDVVTAGDSDVCDSCLALANDGPYTLDEVRGLLPDHVRCRCFIAPA